MPRVRPLLSVIIAVAASVITVGRTAGQADTPVSAIDSAEAEVKSAAKLYREKKFRDAGGAVQRAQQSLESLPAEARLGGRPSKLYKQLAKARALLELEGIKLPPLQLPMKTATASRTSPRSMSAKISFVKQVVPILVARCGECHVTGTRGRFSMLNFTALAKGGRSGPAYVEGKGQDSLMVKLIQTGKMPRDGSPVPPEELATLSKWIDEGARFDGSDVAAPLVNQVALTAAGPRPNLEVVRASGKEQVLFGRDVGPALLANCMGCHSQRLTLGDLRLDTFSRILRGGQSGAIVVPGKGDESLLVRKLRGQAGARMPMRRDPLPEATIAKIAKWIDDGARYDADDPTQLLAEVVSMVSAQRASHDELTKMRHALTAKNWHLMLPDTKPSMAETENFLIYGTLGPNTLAQTGELAEKQLSKLRRFLRPPAGQPFIKGKMTIYVFDKRYDYSEIGAMIERREIPPQWKGHWRYTYTDAYGCALVPGASDDYSLPVLLAQQIAGIHVSSQGRIPRWFAEGSARAIAGKLDPKDSRVRGWDQRIPEILAEAGRPDAFISGALPPEETEVLSYGFLKFLMSKASQYHAVLAGVRSGMTFDQAFAKSFGGQPSQLAAAWAARAASGKHR